ncbi:MAG: sialate O-acetylesterase [Gemmatimonadota bacterium]|nr:sialate O-acetylesterase [Gemmatimonadota bacterium]
MSTRSLFIKTLSFLFCLIISSAAHLAAEVRLPRLFGESMVVQQQAWVPVWGWADPGEKVTVELMGGSASAVADENGKWKISLPPMNAGAGPYELKVTGRNTIVIGNVAVGEVWLCSGQSNMAMTVRRCLNSEAETAAADWPLIRQFQVKRGKSLEPLGDIPVGEDEKSWLSIWRPCSPETVGSFTGAGYFFARSLHRTLGVPIGLIHSSWGGTTAEAWTRRGWLGSDPELKRILDSWPGYNYDESWLTEEYEKYLAKLDEARSAGTEKPIYFNCPSVLYNSMIAPLIPYAIRGVIWYQGESNAGRAAQYGKLFPSMIRNWRADWAQGDFPFLFQQLVNFRNGGSVWPDLREAQGRALSLPNTGMAVGIDIGDPGDVHPKNKQEVGRRLALVARAKVYGEKVLCSGPLFKCLKVEGEKCRVSFCYPGDGLVAKGGSALKWFQVAGADKKFIEGEARIEGNEVVVWSEQVKKPVAVRYAWADNPEGCNLWNTVDGKAWLPAAPFRTDDW